MKKSRPLKVLQTEYVVKINGQPVQSFGTSPDAKTDLAAARKYVANLSINDTIESVSIVRITTTEATINNYTPKVQRVLTVDDLGFDEEGDTLNG
jgi:hypothetical protein